MIDLIARHRQNLDGLGFMIRFIPFGSQKNPPLSLNYAKNHLIDRCGKPKKNKDTIFVGTTHQPKKRRFGLVVFGLILVSMLAG